MGVVERGTDQITIREGPRAELLRAWRHVHWVKLRRYLGGSDPHSASRKAYESRRLPHMIATRQSG